jgi:hypothetical protein
MSFGSYHRIKAVVIGDNKALRALKINSVIYELN